MSFTPHAGTNKVKTIADIAPCPDNKGIQVQIIIPSSQVLMIQYKLEVPQQQEVKILVDFMLIHLILLM